MGDRIADSWILYVYGDSNGSFPTVIVTKRMARNKARSDYARKYGVQYIRVAANRKVQRVAAELAPEPEIVQRSNGSYSVRFGNLLATISAPIPNDGYWTNVMVLGNMTPILSKMYFSDLDSAVSAMINLFSQLEAM